MGLLFSKKKEKRGKKSSGSRIMSFFLSGFGAFVIIQFLND